MRHTALRILGFLLLSLVWAAPTRGQDKEAAKMTADLLRELGSRNYTQTRHAMLDVMALPEDRLAPLVQRLSEPPSDSATGLALDTQLNLITTFAQIRGTPTCKALEGLMADTKADPLKRKYAAMALRSHDSPTLEATLLAAVRESAPAYDKPWVSSALMALGRHGKTEFVKLSGEILASKEADRRAKGMILMNAGIYLRKDMASVVAGALKDLAEDSYLTMLALYAAGRLNDGGMSEAILSVKPANRNVKMFQILAMPTVAPDKAKPILDAGMIDDDTRLRVLSCLMSHEMKMGDEVTLPLLKKIVEDRRCNEKLRSEAVLGLALYPEAIEWIKTKCLPHPDLHIRLGACRALRHLGGEHIRAVEAQIAKERDNFGQQVMMDCLAGTPTKDITETLLKILPSANMWLKCRISMLLGSGSELKDTKIKALRRLCKDTDPEIRELAFWSLTRLCTDAELKSSLGLTKDDRTFVSRGAARAVEARAGKSVLPFSLLLQGDNTKSLGLDNATLHGAGGIYARISLSHLMNLLALQNRNNNTKSTAASQKTAESVAPQETKGPDKADTPETTDPTQEEAPSKLDESGAITHWDASDIVSVTTTVDERGNMRIDIVIDIKKAKGDAKPAVPAPPPPPAPKVETPTPAPAPYKVEEAPRPLYQVETIDPGQLLGKFLEQDRDLGLAPKETTPDELLNRYGKRKVEDENDKEGKK